MTAAKAEGKALRKMIGGGVGRASMYVSQGDENILRRKNVLQCVSDWSEEWHKIYRGRQKTFCTGSE